MANKDKRFTGDAPAKENPGPGSYTLSKRSDWIKEVGRPTVSAPPEGKEVNVSSWYESCSVSGI